VGAHATSEGEMFDGYKADSYLIKRSEAQIAAESGKKKDSGSARQGETANTRNVQPPESP
jgi:hypothetical protein